ncbi:MAG: HTTM domain-containing protein [Acidobacteriota bacterium]
MTSDSVRGRRALPIVDAVAPAERLAMLRLLTGAFALVYVSIRLPVFLQLGERRRGFDGVGLAALLDRPVSEAVVVVTVVATLAGGIGYLLGWRFRVTGPLFAIGMLALGSYRGSWGQLLHFENLMVLYLLIVALSPSADAWSLDARDSSRRRPPSTRYGWPIALASLVLVVTYVIAGIAKLRYGGIDWVFGDTLRNHVAYAAARLELLGGNPSPLAGWAVRNEWVWPVAAAATIVVELAAPVALVGGRVRTAWVIATWSMHAAILAFMLILFPFPLFLVAFAPLYRIERLWTDRPVWMRRATAVQPA